MEPDIIKYSSWREALSATILKSGKTTKEVALALWPSKLETAAADLNEMLNPNKNRKPSIDELIFICNFCQRYDVIFYITFRCNLTTPTLKTETEKVQDLQAAIAHLVVENENQAKFIETLKQVFPEVIEKKQAPDVVEKKQNVMRLKKGK